MSSSTTGSLTILDVWRRSDEFAPGLKPRLALVVACSFVSGLGEAAVLVFVARLALVLTQDRDEITLGRGLHASVGTAVVICLVAIAVKFASAALAARASVSAIGRTLTATRVSLMREYLESGWGVQSSQPHGDLHDLVSTHADKSAALISSLTYVVGAALNVLMLILVAAVVDIRAAAATVVAGVVLSGLVRPIANRARASAAGLSRSGRRFASTVTELVSMTREVDLFGVEEKALERVRTDNAEQVRFYMRSRFLGAMTPQIYQAGALAAIVLGIGLLSNLGGETVAEVGPVVILLLRAVSYGQQLQASMHGFRENSPFVDAVRSQRQMFRAGAQTPGQRPMSSVGELRCEDLSFSYRLGAPVVREVSVSIPPGEMLGIVGPSGSGKSTLLQLLLRLRTPTSGRVTIDGIDVQEIRPEDWSTSVTFVPQDARLFSGTVAENIAFFRDVDEKAIRLAAERAGILEEIEALPAGFDELLGPTTTSLSGGQQQRLCIARALVVMPKILVLDEPTSALDPRSEQRVQQTLQQLRGELTIVVVAHRLTTVASCDRVLVLADGRCQAVGSHAELLASSPYYAEVLRLSSLVDG